MTLDSLLKDLIDVASSAATASRIKGYLFGSALRPDFPWTDVDILVVCEDADDVSRMRAALMPVCAVAPVDLMVMSTAEEAELNFVSGQGCRELFDIGS